MDADDAPPASDASEHRSRALGAAMARQRAAGGDVASSDDRDGDGDASSSTTSASRDDATPATTRPPPPPPLVLPDEVVLRILKHALPGDAFGTWSVGGRFRAPHRAATRGDADASATTTSTTTTSTSTTMTSTTTTTPRGPLRLVCAQWRRLLDASCAHLEARRAVVFGDDELASLARVVHPACRRLTLEGSHAHCGRLALTDAGLQARVSVVFHPPLLGFNARSIASPLNRLTDGVALQAALSALGAHAGHVRALEVTRTGMPLHAVFRAASRCVGLRRVLYTGPHTTALAW